MASKAIDKILEEEKDFDEKLHDYASAILERTKTRSVNELIGPFNRIILPLKFAELFANKFQQNFKTYEFLTSEKCYINKKLFHSFNYKRKGNLNSYSICFLYENREHFGDILTFVDFQNNLYGILKVYKILDINLVLPKCPALFESFITPVELETYYQLIDINSFVYKLINCNFFLHKCFVINNGKNIFYSKLSYDFEHD